MSSLLPISFGNSGTGWKSSDEFEPRRHQASEYEGAILVLVFQAGKYLLDEDATFAEGDASGDLRFNSNDLTRALAGGGYETKMKYSGDEAVANVPEPYVLIPFAIGIIAVAVRTRRSGSH